MSNSRSRIVVTEIPYMVNKAKLVEKIAELVPSKAAGGHHRHPRRERPQRHAHRHRAEDATCYPQVVLNYLYKHTQMQETFGANMLALVDGEPAHPEPAGDASTTTSTIRRTLSPAAPATTWTRPRPAAHILEGLLKALDHIDEIVSDHPRQRGSHMPRKAALMERFAFSDKQAQAILDMRLARLTGLEREKLHGGIRRAGKDTSPSFNSHSGRRGTC